MLQLSFSQVALIVAGVLAYFGVLFFGYRALPERARPPFLYFAAFVSIAAFFYVLGEYIPNHDRTVELSKAAIAISAAGCVFFEQHRKAMHRPIAERWKKFVGVTLALAAISAYFNGFNFGYPKYYHRWDQYHYYMGAKYFTELGYTSLYKCGVIAEEELGTLTVHYDRVLGRSDVPSEVIPFTAEVRDADKKVRDLGGEFSEKYGGDNLIVPVQDILAHPEQCKGLFTPERWEQYKNDVKFFRVVSGKQYWTDMQNDHGFNPPPVWTIGGKFFSDLAPTSVHFLQFLAALDLVYLAAMFVVLWWGFGWRVFAVGAIFWGCQSSAPFYWTGGAFLRQDWLFYLVLSVAAMRRRCFKIGGAALVYAGLLRIFPGLVVIGTLVPFIAHIVRRRAIHRDHKQMLLGGVLAALVLLPLSSWMTMPRDGSPLRERLIQPYVSFYKHTLQVHDKTPLTNHMGLRVIIAHRYVDFVPFTRTPEEQQAYKESLPANRKWLSFLAPVQLPVRIASGKSSGHMEYVRNDALTDPFKVWKEMRNERYHKYRSIAYAIIAACLLFFVLVVSRIQSLWVAQCLGQVFIILLSQLTCYYYSFMILGAPLIKMRRPIELGLFGVAAISQIIWMNSFWNDNRYTALTIASLVWCLVMIGMFWRRQPSAAPAEARVKEQDQDQSEAQAA